MRRTECICQGSWGIDKRIPDAARQFGDDVFSFSCGGDPAVAYDRMMRRTLLMQRMEEVLTPRELNLVRSYLGIGQPDEVGLTFQELAIRLNYNGPSGAEKALANRFACEVAALIRVYEVLSGA